MGDIFGPRYWGHAAGKLYDYLELLSIGTSKKVDIFHHPIIRNMGEYIVRSYAGKGWVVNFADASARGEAKPWFIVDCLPTETAHIHVWFKNLTMDFTFQTK